MTRIWTYKAYSHDGMSVVHYALVVNQAGKEAEEAQWEAQKRAVVAAESAKTEAFRELLREQVIVFNLTRITNNNA